MGISNLTVMIIATRGDDCKVDAGGPTEEGKYVGWITLYKSNGEYDHELLNGPDVDTKEEAIQMMQGIVDAIRSNVSPEDVAKKISKLLSPEEVKVVGEIIKDTISGKEQ